MPEVHHTGITVKDLERSINFYSEHFGLQLVNRTDLAGEAIEQALGVPGAAISVAILAAGNTLVEFLQYTSAPGDPDTRSNACVGSAHICITVEDIDSIYEQMSAKGVIFNAPPSPPVPEGEAAGSRFLYLVDQDGITVELSQPGPGIRLSTILDG